MCAHFECVLILSVFSFWVCSHFECVPILSVFSFWRCSHFGCVPILSVFSFWRWPNFESVLILNVFSFWQYPKTPRAPYSISFPTLRREKQDGASQLARVCRCARRHTKVFAQRDMALQSPDVSEETIDFLIHRLEQLSQHLLRIMQTVNMSTSEQILLEDVTSCISL